MYNEDDTLTKAKIKSHHTTKTFRPPLAFCSSATMRFICTRKDLVHIFIYSKCISQCHILCSTFGHGIEINVFLICFVWLFLHILISISIENTKKPKNKKAHIVVWCELWSHAMRILFIEKYLHTIYIAVYTNAANTYMEYANQLLKNTFWSVCKHKCHMRSCVLCGLKSHLANLGNSIYI